MQPVTRTSLARAGEGLAYGYLFALGYQIHARNWRTYEGELDLVAETEGQLVIVEVKTRRRKSHGFGAEAVDRRKQHALMRLARSYMHHTTIHRRCRFDVICIQWEAATPQITHLKNAFP